MSEQSLQYFNPFHMGSPLRGQRLVRSDIELRYRIALNCNSPFASQLRLNHKIGRLQQGSLGVVEQQKEGREMELNMR